jgi:hypothetical protein
MSTITLVLVSRNGLRRQYKAIENEDEYLTGNVNFKKLSNSINTNYYYTNTYIPLTLYPRRGSRSILDIPPRNPRFTKIS